MKHTLQSAAEPGEERVMIVRRHWFLLVKRTVFVIVLALVPLIFFLLTQEALLPTLEERSTAGVLFFMGTSLYYLYLFLFFLHAWVDYDLDVWIVSTRRIVNIEQHGLFSRVVSELFLDKIQDVTTEVRGVVATAMHFGDVHIQTAGENPRFLFDDVPNPSVIAQKIMELHRTYLTQVSQGTVHKAPVSPPTPTTPLPMK